MSFNPECFLSLAKTLNENDICDGEENKVKYCTIVNRSYYAVFLRIRNILEDQFNESPQERGEHYRVRQSLTTKMNEGELFQSFKTLWKDRVKADYAFGQIGTGINEFEKFANGSFITAEFLLNELEKYD